MLNINKIENISKKIIKSVSNEKLLPFYKKVQAQKKSDGSLITQADIEIQKLIKSELYSHFPEFDFFAEELTEEEHAQFFANNHSGYWCLDPIDGTSNFASTLPYFSISLALIINGETVMGLVYDPMRDECFSAIKDQGAKLNGEPIKRLDAPKELSECIAIIDFKRLNTELSVKLVTDLPCRSQRSFGSVALDWCWLAMGRGQLYLHGKQMLWDYAAGLLIATEAGCVSCTLDDEVIFQESLIPRQIVASINNDLQKQWVKFVF